MLSRGEGEAAKQAMLPVTRFSPLSPRLASRYGIGKVLLGERPSKRSVGFRSRSRQPSLSSSNIKWLERPMVSTNGNVAITVASLSSLAMDLLSFEGEELLFSVAVLKVWYNGGTRPIYAFVIFQSICFCSVMEYARKTFSIYYDSWYR